MFKAVHLACEGQRFLCLGFVALKHMVGAEVLKQPVALLFLLRVGPGTFTHSGPDYKQT